MSQFLKAYAYITSGTLQPPTQHWPAAMVPNPDSDATYRVRYGQRAQPKPTQTMEAAGLPPG
jgi:hypothetical protein